VNFERETLPTTPADWVVGPYHSPWISHFRAHFTLDGEIIVRAGLEGGFLHRGLEKALELHPWQSSIVYAGRVDPEAASFAEHALCLAVEKLCELEVPARAQCIRVIVDELTRVSSHLKYIARIAQATSSETMVHFALRDREKILDLFELLSGARFSLSFLRFGGVANDVTEGFIERVVEVCDLIRFRLKEYNDLFSYNQAFLARSAYVGVVEPGFARRCGLTGPNARASAIVADVRKTSPYSGYEQLDFEVPLGQGEGGAIGDAHDRYVIRLREITQSLEILRQVCDALPAGPFASAPVERDFKVPTGEAYARVESARGLLGCYAVADGSARPTRVQFRVPTGPSWQLAPMLLEGARLQDAPTILASLDLCVSELDR